ncbi:hypothetical protein [Anabaena subtropica]|uniref:Type II secretion system protein GspC N-terminal domain-containing protein n=1 Tax=Anabaena subtropica FACHB-260 TaxID=2692884 RepID=A0ABR8CIH4_9NOST|nr:hypothetical protein [Anabaena subtropica]MBD2342849.1 hypothetical protein [Anabaena subtropica FACHB-260]
MLQEVSTHLIIPEPSEDLIVNEPWSIEFYADGLMDELFADIDEILDVNLPHLTNRRGRQIRQASPVSRMKETVASDWFHNSSNPSHQQTIEYERLQTLDVQQIVLPNTLNRTVQTVGPLTTRQGGKVVVDTQSFKPVTRIRQQAQMTLGKLLIVGTSIGVAIAGVLYIVQSGVLVLLTSRLTQANIYVPQTPLLTQPDVKGELANYMLGALAVIDKSNIRNQPQVRSEVSNRVSYNPTAQTLNNNQQPLGNLPSPLTANNTSPVPSRPNVVERIYIPVYQAPLPMRYAPPPIPGVASPNSSPSPSNVVNNTLNQVQPAANPATVNMLTAAVRPDMKPVAVRNAPINVQPSPKLLPTLPVVPFGASLPKQLNSGGDAVPVASLTVNSAAPAPTHTLEGLLELGNKSVALFQVNGASRRVSVGETIGASGWTLVDVNNGEAIVRRNGEVRSIYAGQKL